MPDLIRVGTRGSLLAKTQTEWVLEQLRLAHPGIVFEAVVILTRGDANRQQLPARLLGKGVFTKEIEDALLAHQIDLAVHSLKDLPTEWPAGLALGAVPRREDARDALVGATIQELLSAPEKLRIGTSSLRRAAQLRRLLPGCTVASLRGNIDTRLQKVATGVVDCAVLAAAGLSRLGLSKRIDDYFDPRQMLPPPGQGALALEIRSDDGKLRELLQAVHCPATWACVVAERAFMRQLGGGCQLPVGALASLDGARLRLAGRVLSVDGQQEIAGFQEGAVDQPEGLGRQLADRLLEQGAAALIGEIEESLRQEQKNG